MRKWRRSIVWSKVELLQKNSAIKRIKERLGLQFGSVKPNRDFSRIYISERNRFEWTVRDDLGKSLHEKMVAYINIVADVMRQWFKEGEIRSMNPLDLGRALVGIVNSFVFEWMISRNAYSLISKLDTVLENSFGGVQRIERRR
jgi:hypothetical protein